MAGHLFGHIPAGFLNKISTFCISAICIVAGAVISPDDHAHNLSLQEELKVMEDGFDVPLILALAVADCRVEYKRYGQVCVSRTF